MRERVLFLGESAPLSDDDVRSLYQIALANEVIDALGQANREGRGTIMLNGRLVEQHHVSAAKRMLALVEMIGELESA